MGKKTAVPRTYANESATGTADILNKRAYYDEYCCDHDWTTLHLVSHSHMHCR